MRRELFVFSLLVLFSFTSLCQPLYQKCYALCGGLSNSEYHCYNSSLVQDFNEKYTYVYFSTYDGNALLCKFDSVGNNIYVKGMAISSALQISTDSVLLQHSEPQKILRINDNLYVTISITDSTIENTSSQTVTSYCGLVIATFDSTFSLVSCKRYLTTLPLIQPTFDANPHDYLQAQIIDSGRFEIAVATLHQNNGPQSTIYIARFDSLGSLLTARNCYLPGSDLSVTDLKIATDGSLLILVNIDTVPSVIKMNSSLEILWTKEYSVPALAVVPTLLNIKSNSDITVVSSINSQSVLIINADSALNIYYSQLIESDSNFSLTKAVDGREVTLFTTKNRNDGQSTVQQDIILIDSSGQSMRGFMREVNYMTYPMYYSGLPLWGDMIQNQAGYAGLCTQGYFTPPGGEMYDVYVDQLDIYSALCGGILDTSYYYYSPVQVNISSINISDSTIIFPVDSIITSFNTVNQFNFTYSCYSYVSIPEAENNIKKNFIFSPNPFHATAVLNSSDHEIKNASLKIFNTIGALVREEEIHSINSFILHRGNLHEGLYFFELRSDAGFIATGKFVIE
jgi:hypothetical protein